MMRVGAPLPAPQQAPNGRMRACFTALAEAFEWIDQLLHIPLREPQRDISEPYMEIVEGTELYAPNRLQPQVNALCNAAGGRR